MTILSSDFHVVHASGGDWENLTRTCLENLGDLARGTNVGFLYMTDCLDEDVRSIFNLLRSKTNIHNWVGTLGFGICISGEELFDVPAMAVMVGHLPVNSFHTLPVIKPDTIELKPEFLHWAKDKNPTLGLVHADPRVPNIEKTLAMIQGSTGCFLVGGITSSRGAHEQVVDEVTDGGVSGILFGSEIKACTGITQGCTPIGGFHMVTSVEGNIIQSLDKRPAFEVFRDDIGDLLAHDLRRTQGYVHAALPVRGSDTGDYLVRNLVGVSPDDGTVAIGDFVDVGDMVMFVRRDGASAISDLQRMVSDLKNRMDVPIKAAFYISCVARGPNLFGKGSVELKTIQKILGDLPLIGFFANGEISNNSLHGYSGVLTLLG